MPMFDTRCTVCGNEQEMFAHRFSLIEPCRACGGTVGRIVAPARHSVIGDELDYWDENLGPEPVHVRSHAQRRRLMLASGREEFVRHTGVPGTDKSPHTTDWSKGSIDAQTLENAKLLLERVGQQGKTAEAPDVDFIKTDDGRRIGLTLGRQYSGTIDPSFFEG